MNNQEYLKGICLLGSDRQKLDITKLSAPLSEEMAKLDGLDSAEKILHALSLDNYYRLAGRQLPVVGKIVETAPITEFVEYAPDSWYTLLEKIIDTEKQKIQSMFLGIWAKRLVDSKKIVHPMYLVKYFNILIGASKSIRELALPTYGEKGKWLIKQNHKYRKLDIQVQDDVWSYGTNEERRQYLVNLIQADPKEAIRKVEESWPSESPREKLRHLDTLLHHHNTAFLSFLVKLYNSEYVYNIKETVTHRKSRNVLANTLLLIPQSSLHQQTIKALGQYTNTTKGGVFLKVFQNQKDVLQIPETEDAFFNSQQMLSVYGIDPKSTLASEYKTDQLFWFSQLCASIPFDAWSKITGNKLNKILDTFLSSAQYKVTVNNKQVSCLKRSLIGLTEVYRDDKYLIELLNNETDKVTAQILLSRLSPSVWEEYLLKNLDWVDNTVLQQCPHKEDEMWSLTFSKKLIDFTIGKLQQPKNQFDYTIGMTMSRHLNREVLNYLIKVKSNHENRFTHYQYWKRHIFDPIYETVEIRNLIQQLPN